MLIGQNMKNATSSVIKYATYALLAASMLIVTGGLFRSCGTIDDLSFKLGQERARNAALDAAAAVARKERDAAVAAANEATSRCVRTEAASADKDATISASNAVIANLKKERAGLKDKDEIIKNQDGQIAALSANLTLMTEDRDAWKSSAIEMRDVSIPALNGVIATLSQQGADEHQARRNQEAITKKLLGQRKAAMFSSAVEKAVILALGIVVAVKVL